MKTVAFYQPFMNERGTCVAMFDYAYFNQTLLGNRSVFLYDSLDSRNELKGLNRIKDNFETFDVHCSDHNVSGNSKQRSEKIDAIVEKNTIDYVYMCKSGYNDGVIATKAKTLVHVMGMVDSKECHGDVWAYVSFFSSRACSGGKLPAVPYMVTLPDETGNMRDELGIPSDAIVFGRHGGQDTFDPWAYGVINEVLNKKSNVYFVFLNTPKMLNHPRVKFLDAIVDPVQKTRFINTCDAMIHVRWVGETFGMACAEFSFRNKPVITDFRSPERNHIEILGDRGLYFDSERSFYDRLMNFTINNSTDWNCYREYTPEKVMKIFDEVYLK